ncbi:vitamin K epoxide reductase family protein [Pedobacter sp. GSP4]|uniref:vitamin K epoxide reductase family protein n=1 Tax=Pedobacter sp. GSP4 TaxID=3453716 RepID=UPI003EEDB632
MNLFKRQSNNIVAVTQLLVEKLKVSVTKTTVAQCLTDHPDYPSLMAVTDCLSDWYIANEARNIPKVNYKEYEMPYIAQLTSNGGSFILVNGVNSQGQISYSDEKHLKALMPEDEFLQKWSGSVLRAEANNESTEPNYKNARLAEVFNTVKIPFFILIIIGAILFALPYQSLTVGYGLFLLLKLTGIGLSVLLLAHSIDANNPLVQNLCSLGNKNNCNAILKSDVAKITNWLSWSEVGFFYFTGTFLCLLLNAGSINFVVLLSILALPYTFYSISYQFRHKNWCMLCCAVQAVLLLENLTFLGFNLWSSSLSSPPFLTALSSLICLLFPILIWSLLKPFLLNNTEYEPLKQQVKKFKYNDLLFNQALINQPRYVINDELLPVVLGNPEAETIITIVSNPFCGPCGKAHQTLDEWLKTRDDLQLKIIFTTADHEDDTRTKVSRHISALTQSKDVVMLEQALNDWYGSPSRKYEQWAEKYPVNFSSEMNAVTQKQKDWCERAEISFTPTILINGYKLPEPYRLEDIKYLLS